MEDETKGYSYRKGDTEESLGKVNGTNLLEGVISQSLLRNTQNEEYRDTYLRVGVSGSLNNGYPRCHEELMKLAGMQFWLQEEISIIIDMEVRYIIFKKITKDVYN